MPRVTFSHEHKSPYGGKAFRAGQTVDVDALTARHAIHVGHARVADAPAKAATADTTKKEKANG